MDQFFQKVDEAAQEYDLEYKPELERLRAAKVAKEFQDKQEHLRKLMNDMSVGKGVKKNKDEDESSEEQEDSAEDDRV